MKYCVKCGNPMDDAMQFCQKCGTKCVSFTATEETEHASQPDIYAEYWGLHYKDFESSKEIELTPDGVHIYKQKGMKQFRFDKTIPYVEILEVNSVRATAIKSGYFSIITTTEGITGEATRMQLLNDHNTVLFTKKTEPEAERIYHALEDICSAPPQSNAQTTYYESYSGEQVKTQYPTLSNPAKPKKRSGCLVPIVIFVVLLIAIIAIPKLDTARNYSQSNSAQQSEQENINSPEDYTGDVFTAFWEGASDFFGVEYSDYKWTHTATSYICDYETSDGYTAHYYLIKTAFETKNAFGQDVLHEVTARCYYVPDYSNTVYTTYLTLDGEVVSYDEETECWLMNMDGGGTAPATSEESTGILWSAFVNAYNEMAAEDPEGNGYLIDAEISGNTLEYSFPNGETLSVDVTNGKHIIRMEYIYPSTGTSDQTIIMHRWWVISSIVGAIQHELYGNDWSETVSTKTEDILADVALAGGSDEDKATYQSGKALTSSDLEHSIIYTRYVDLEKEQSHFIVYGYSDDVLTPPTESETTPTIDVNDNNDSTSKQETVPPYISTEDMNEFLVAYILPQYITLQGDLHNAVEYDSSDSTDWCYKLVGQVGADSYEAMVYPFQLGKGNEITDLWIAYLYWNGELVERNDYSERINYSPKKYW